MRHIIRSAVRASACAVLAAGGAVALGTAASAAPPDAAPPDPAVAPAPAATSTVALPLLGAPVTVAVTTDAGGSLLDVSLSPSDSLNANPVHLNHVSFVNEDGTVKLRVAAVWGGERVSARAGSLDEISGPGSWSGDVFGTGVTTDVAFTVGATAEGGPDITGVTVASPLTYTVGDVKRDTEGSRQSAKVTIEFTDQGQQRWLTIKATTSDRNDGSAGLKVALSHPWGARLEQSAVGAHTWNGALCDGTAATVNYTVTEAGDITDVTASPDADVRTMGKFVWVGFDRSQGVSLFARHTDDGLQVGALDKFHCDHAFPTVNGEEAEQANWPGWGPGSHDGPHQGPGWGGPGHHDGHGPGEQGGPWGGRDGRPGGGPDHGDHDHGDHDGHDHDDGDARRNGHDDHDHEGRRDRDGRRSGGGNWGGGGHSGGWGG